MPKITRKDNVRGQAGVEHEIGTVGWLIEQLKSYDPSMFVLSGDHDGYYYDITKLDIFRIDEGVEVVPELMELEPGDELPGTDVVCLLPY